MQQSHSIIQRLLPSAGDNVEINRKHGSTVRYGRLPVFVFEEVIGCLPKHCGRAESFSPRGRFGGCGYRRSSGVSEFSAVSEGAVLPASALAFAFEISPSDSSPPFCGSSSLCGASATLATPVPLVDFHQSNALRVAGNDGNRVNGNANDNAVITDKHQVPHCLRKL